MDHKKVITRFAVSPTGFMHIGGVRTALYSYLYARKHGGEFVLRIEDTDKSREEPGAVEHIIASLRWLGIEWDYGPDRSHPEWGSAVQSERLPIYKDYAQHLIDKGLAYPDPYSSEELRAFREQADAEKRPFLYRHHRPNTFEPWDGTKPLRLKVPEIKRYEWHDAVRGDLTGGQEMLDDIVLIKSDGYPTYNFCHIVDDHVMGVTHVMRSDEFISSMPRFLSIHDALNIERPTFCSLPPILGPAGNKKLSKRDGAKDVLEYKADGYLPEAMLNFLALIGWNPGSTTEIMDKQTLIESFSIEKVQRSGGAFDIQKLQWMNKEHLATKPQAIRTQYVLDALPNRDHDVLSRLAPSILERAHTAAEIRTADKTGEYDWAFNPISYDAELLQWKQDDTVTDALPRLQHARKLLQTAVWETPDTIKTALWPYAEEVGKGQVLWPLRVALTGRERSPDPFTCAHVLGQTETLARITQACDKIIE
jgi:glutamyl-tRNA synthetase